MSDGMMGSTTIWACVDCTMLDANGVLPSEAGGTSDDDERVKAGFAALVPNNVTMGIIFGEEGCEHNEDNWNDDETHSEECERKVFSRWQCDICRSPLAGERQAFTLWSET